MKQLLIQDRNLTQVEISNIHDDGWEQNSHVGINAKGEKCLLSYRIGYTNPRYVFKSVHENFKFETNIHSSKKGVILQFLGFDANNKVFSFDNFEKVAKFIVDPDCKNQYFLVELVTKIKDNSINPDPNKFYAALDKIGTKFLLSNWYGAFTFNSELDSGGFRFELFKSLNMLGTIKLALAAGYEVYEFEKLNDLGNFLKNP